MHTNAGAIFGGYADCNWASSGGYVAGTDAFLYTFVGGPQRFGVCEKKTKINDKRWDSN